MHVQGLLVNLYFYIITLVVCDACDGIGADCLVISRATAVLLVDISVATALRYAEHQHYYPWPWTQLPGCRCASSGKC